MRTVSAMPGEVWWSEATIDPTWRPVASGNAYRLHQMVEAVTDGVGYGGGEQRTLWRLNRNVVLIQSARLADWSRYDVPVLSTRERRIDDVWSKLREGMEVSFSCVVAPAVAKWDGVPNGSRGRRMPIWARDIVGIQKWWGERALRCGFEPVETRVVAERVVGLQKRQDRYSLSGVELGGRLCIMEVEPFVAALERGIGRCKSLGCGLLLFAPRV